MRRCVDGEGKHLTRCSRQLSLVKQYMSVQSHLSLITKPNDGCRLTKRPGYGLEVWWRLESLARVASQPDEMDARCVASSRGGGVIAGPVLCLGGVLPRIASARGRGRTGGGSFNCCTTTPRRAQADELMTGREMAFQINQSN